MTDVEPAVEQVEQGEENDVGKESEPVKEEGELVEEEGNKGDGVGDTEQVEKAEPNEVEVEQAEGEAETADIEAEQAEADEDVAEVEAEQADEEAEPVEGEAEPADGEAEPAEDAADAAEEEADQAEEAGDQVEGEEDTGEPEADESAEVSEAPDSVTVVNVEEIDLETGEIHEEHMTAFSEPPEEATEPAEEATEPAEGAEEEGKEEREQGVEEETLAGETEEDEAVGDEKVQEGEEGETQEEESKEAELGNGTKSGEIDESREEIVAGVTDSDALSVLHEEGEPDYEEPAIVSPQPQEFRLRAMADEFTLDREFDENELMSLLDVRSVMSMDSVALSMGTPIAVPGVRPSKAGMLTTVERENLYEQHRALSTERAHLLRTNSVLQRRLMEHYKRRNMTEMFKEPKEFSPDVALRYAKQLAWFGDAQAIDTAARSLAAEELSVLDAEEYQQAAALQSRLDALVEIELEESVGLVDSKTGKMLSERQVEKLLLRQRNRVRELVEQRIIFSKLRDAVDAKEAATRELEDLGEGTKMADYEQLRVESQNLADKVEERDEELARLRLRTQNLVTALAHLREKSSTYVGAIEQKGEQLKAKEEKLDVFRSELTKEKTLRDRLRADFIRETDKAGLLTNPHLLRDFEETLDERDELRTQLAAMRSKSDAELRELEELRESCERSAAAGDGDKPSRYPTYKELVERRLDEQKTRREAASVKEKVVVYEVEEMFQMR